MNTHLGTQGRQDAAATAGTPYLTARPAEGALRLICFHHAGGGASVFADWQRTLGPAVSVLPVQLPGRERRIREPRFTDMATLVPKIDAALDPFLCEPYVLYGHSMGALVAYNLTMARLAAGRSLPAALMVGACSPPHLPPISSTTRGLSDSQLTQWLHGMGGISDMMLNYPSWVQAAVSLLRDDLKLCDSHRYSEFSGAPLLSCPIHAFAGRDDPALAVDVIAEWDRHTRGMVSLGTVRGGHLFIRDSQDVFLDMLSARLEGVNADAKKFGRA